MIRMHLGEIFRLAFSKFQVIWNQLHFLPSVKVAIHAWITKLNHEFFHMCSELSCWKDLPPQHDSDLRHTARTTLEWLEDKCLNVLEWPGLDLNLFWKSVGSWVHWSSSNLTELERMWGMGKTAQIHVCKAYRCKLNMIQSCNYCQWSLNTSVFLFKIDLENLIKSCFHSYISRYKV